MIPPSTSDTIEVWADVGGTFTDCFALTGSDRSRCERRSIKVLSSGKVRARVVSIAGSEVVVDAIDDVDGFWQGARAVFFAADTENRSVENAAGAAEAAATVVGFRRRDRCLTLDRIPPEAAAGCVIELDAGLEAPVLAARRLLAVPLGEPLPPLDMRLGTTRGTNALLTRRGAEVALITTAGFGDLLEIGEQTRPELFELTIRKPVPLTRRVVEVRERLDAEGRVLVPLDENALRRDLSRLRSEGVRSLAVCLLHAYLNDVHERRIGELAAEAGFDSISLSSRVAPLIKLVARAETTVLDAYLNPVLASYIRRLREQMGAHGRLRLMTSGGNLVDADAFRGCDSILSGPAGGVVALGKIAEAYKIPAAVGLDMGGTSTDVSRYEGRVARQYESRKAGIRVLTPMMAIHTVAAGGGSICDVIDGRMLVGPQSAGADPGPACYGRGGPLTVTDLNVVLGRLPGDRFPFPLDISAARRKLAEVNAKLAGDALPTLEQAAEGFLRIAVTHMSEAVRTVSTAEGSDPRNMALVGFGGAAGGHLCAVADAIGMKRIIDHRDAGLLSALGIGLADVGRVKSVGVYRVLAELNREFWQQTLGQLREETLEELSAETGESSIEAVANGTSSVPRRSPAEVRFEADLRYVGTESSLSLPAEPIESLAARFHQAHLTAFGYSRPARPVEVAAVRCEAVIESQAELDPPTPDDAGFVGRSPAIVPDAVAQTAAGPVYLRDRIVVAARLRGPCVVIDDNSTLVVEPDWTATKLAGNTFELVRETQTAHAATNFRTSPNYGDADADPVMVEVAARRFQGIADAMGEILRRTAISVNIKERLDFSCAVFDARGVLLANAPHVPVHLGAMGHTVRRLIETFPQMDAGDVYLSNDPYAGGSHLPDVTAVTPVFCREHAEAKNVESSKPDFFIASRAHHAEIGGKTPGSMPPDASSLAEEGVVISDFALCRGGVDHEDALRRLLTAGPYPSRTPETNLADIAAQRAAGYAGARQLVEMVTALGRPLVDKCCRRMLDQAGESVGRWIATLGPEPRSFRDSLDDGTVIAVRLTPAEGRLRIDFSGTSGVHPRCFNATPAIVTAATLYVLRTLIGGTLPMNGGITSRIDFVIPPGLLNPPRNDDPRQCPAVVAGNVETSMRVVDVLLGALRVAAASQGTMNNVLIGDSTFGYYETIGGGSGATPQGRGASGVHCHMTNTRITDPEVYETRYPVRLHRFAVRRGSGGIGRHLGGDGLIREIEFLRPLTLSLLTSRRGDKRPWGLAGGEAGEAGTNLLLHPDGTQQSLHSSVTLDVEQHARLIIETPGGGGWGAADAADG